MTGASNRLDPIAAAEAGIVGSKNLMAAVADELSQQQRWLAHYQVAEKRHARRRKVQGILYRLNLARLALMRFLRRLALLTLRLARDVARFLARTAIALFDMLSRAVAAGIAWLGPRAYALARLVERWLTALWLWTSLHAAMLARASIKGAGIAFAWLAATSIALAVALGHWLVRIVRRTKALSRILARNALHGARITFTWTTTNLQVLAALLVQWLSAAWRWTVLGAVALRDWLVKLARRTKALSRILARNALHGAAIASAWSATTSQKLAIALRHWSRTAWRWASVEARIVARASLEGTRRAWSWTDARARVTAGALRRNVSAGAAWSSANAKAATSASLGAISTGYAWGGVTLKTVARNLGHAEPAADTSHRALVLRRCTALICIEPKRARLPMIRAS